MRVMKNNEKLIWEKPQLIVLSQSETQENLLGSPGGGNGCPDTNGNGLPDDC